MLEIKNLHVNVDGREILKGLDLTLPQGEVHAVMGPNGSGKSTLAYVLAGKDDYEVTAGSVTWKGEDLLAISPSERAASGVFLAFQYPMEIPGVATMTFLRTAVNAVRKARGVVEATRASFVRAYQAGVRIAMGSDNGFPDLHGKNAIEIALMAEYGMRAKDVVAASTSVAAQCLGRGDRLGRIAPGFLADIIAVPGDPLGDVRVLGDTAFVMKDGVIYKSP